MLKVLLPHNELCARRLHTAFSQLCFELLDAVRLLRGACRRFPKYLANEPVETSAVRTPVVLCPTLKFALGRPSAAVPLSEQLPRQVDVFLSGLCHVIRHQSSFIPLSCNRVPTARLQPF